MPSVLVYCSACSLERRGADMTMTLTISVVLGTLLAGFVQGLSGFAFGLVAMSVWTWTVDPQLAAPMVVWGSWVGQLLSLRAFRGELALRKALPFVLGGVIGVPIGVWMLGYVDVRLFKAAVGGLLVLYCSAMLLLQRFPVVIKGGHSLDAAVGLVGGAMGGLGGLTGPAPTLWCTLRGWDKDAQRAVFQIFNLSMHSLTLTIYALNGTITAALTPVFTLMVPVAILPTLAGARLYRRFSDTAFRNLVLTLLLASGAMLLVSTYVGRI
jgi:uncharacterized membrane protein YfcA